MCMMTIIKYVKSVPEAWDGANGLILPDMLEENFVAWCSDL